MAHIVRATELDPTWFLAAQNLGAIYAMLKRHARIAKPRRGGSAGSECRMRGIRFSDYGQVVAVAEQGNAELKGREGNRREGKGRMLERVCACVRTHAHACTCVGG